MQRELQKICDICHITVEITDPVNVFRLRHCLGTMFSCHQPGTAGATAIEQTVSCAPRPRAMHISPAAALELVYILKAEGISINRGLQSWVKC